MLAYTNASQAYSGGAMMRKIFVLAAVVFAAVACGATVEAKEGPQVEYSADSYVESAEGTMEGPLFHAPGKERREYVENGQSMVMIIRHDKKVVWMLMPDDKTYMEMKLAKQRRKDDLSSYKVEQTTVGPETVNGVKATKSKIVMTAPNGNKMGGFWWTTGEGIVVKMDAISVDKGGKERLTINLENLKIGKQDPRLFEIPPGYENMAMGGIGNMFKGGEEEDEGAKEDSRPVGGEKKKGFGFKDALDLLK